MTLHRVTVFGGSGFIGRHIVRRLAQKGAVVRVAVRDPEGALFLKPMGGVGQVVPAYADVRDARSVAAAVDGADAVVNAVSLFAARGRLTHEAIHVEGAARLAQAAAEAGVARFVHLSGLGADAEAGDRYIAARGKGDAAVSKAFARASVLRPSVVFGPDDKFFTTLARIARMPVAMPVFGGGKAKVQPVFVGDVAEAAMRCLERPEAAGRMYHLGGPRVYTYREIARLVLAETGFKRPIVSVPFFAARLAATFMKILPHPPITREMLALMAADNTVPAGLPGFAELGIVPTAVESVLPTYMDAFRRGGRFKDTRFA
jgi:NADH dehydrogenase